MKCPNWWSYACHTRHYFSAALKVPIATFSSEVLNFYGFMVIIMSEYAMYNRYRIIITIDYVITESTYIRYSWYVIRFHFQCIKMAAGSVWTHRVDCLENGRKEGIKADNILIQ